MDTKANRHIWYEFLAVLAHSRSRLGNIARDVYYFFSSGDDTLLSTEHTALHSPEMGSPPGLRYGVRNGDPQALPVRNVQTSPPYLQDHNHSSGWGRGLHAWWQGELHCCDILEARCRRMIPKKQQGKQ